MGVPNSRWSRRVARGEAGKFSAVAAVGMSEGAAVGEAEGAEVGVGDGVGKGVGGGEGAGDGDGVGTGLGAWVKRFAVVVTPSSVYVVTIAPCALVVTTS